VAVSAPKWYEGDVTAPDPTSPPGAISLETPRLLLRRWQSNDLDGFAAVNAQPEVMRYINDGRALNRAETAERLAAYQRHWDDHGFGLYAVQLKETGELAGFTGLAVPTFLPEIMPAVEIGWRLGRAYWGRGVATEAARHVVAHARAELGLRRLVSIHVVGNEASARVMMKLGMTLERETVQPDTGRPLRVYAMDL
jgi:RimJ/RimL family protein N-acetyltransferase